MFLLLVFSVCLTPLVSAEWRAAPVHSKAFNDSHILSKASSRQSDQVTLYDNPNYGGDSRPTRLTVGACTNVLDFNDRTSSVRIQEGCVRLWEHIDCEGRFVDVKASGEGSLSNRNFNDEVTSVSHCNFPCSSFDENVEIVNHLNGANDLRDHAEAMKRMMLEWFPFIQGQLSTPAYRKVNKIDVYYDEKDNGIYAAGTEIHIPQGYVRNNKGDTGVFIHEMTHVIHQSRNCPGWVVEGTAELMRRWHYEPKTTPTKPTNQELGNAYVGDWLLEYLNTYMQRPMFYMITKACQEGSWRDSWLKDMTGKDDKEWWRQMVNDKEFPWKRVR